VTVKFTSWSPTRLADYQQCPLMAKLKHLDKLCPECFRGRIEGGYDSPAICDTCHKTIVKGEALERGSIIGKGMEDYLTGKAKAVPAEVEHRLVKKVAKEVKARVSAGTAKIEFMLVLNRAWQPVKGWARDAWLRAKMDVTLFGVKKATDHAHVIDWKTGGLEKKGPMKGAPRVDPKYDDQLSLYTVATLSAFGGLTQATAELVFLDTEEPHDPSVSRETATATRKTLPVLQKRWEDKLKPMMNDDQFAPSPNFGCRWCDFRKEKGGPCQF
jgi:hypothetical protein